LNSKHLTLSLATLAAALALLSSPACAAQPQAPSTSPAQLDFAQLRARLRWLPVQVDGRALETPDAASRLLLAKSAAQKAGLSEVGLDFRDVYGVISAETTWVPREGMGKNGKASYGLAQFEQATARAVGLRNPDDAVEAVHAAARHLKEAAQWSAQRIARLKLTPEERARKLREGVSIYYNLSSRARSLWNGMNTAQLPVETQRHIRNMSAGVQQAQRLAGGAPLPTPVAPVLTASADGDGPARAGTPARSAKAAPARPLGTIAWSAEAQREGAGQTYVVWSDGKVSRQQPPAGAGGGYITFRPNPNRG
jgi:hypothetical protein